MGLVSLVADVDHVALRNVERGGETIRVRGVFKQQLVIVSADLGQLVHHCLVETCSLREQCHHCNITEIHFALVKHTLLLKEHLNKRVYSY